MPQQGSSPFEGGGNGGSETLKTGVVPGPFVLVALGALVLGACGDESSPDGSPGEAPAAEPAAQPEAASASAPDGPTPSAVPPTSFGCVRGGTSRAEVVELVGEPDSVSYGVWFYGGSQVVFGYGVVLDYSEEDVDLRLCDP